MTACIVCRGHRTTISFAAGKATKSALTEVFKSWGISLSSYTGPDVSHSKILYKNAYLGDVVRGILDEARKKAGGKAIVRSTENQVSIVAGWRKQRNLPL